MIVLKLLSVSPFATIARKSFKGKFYCKNRVSDQAFCVTITDSDIGGLKSLHTLFDKYLNQVLVKFEQSRMVRNVQNFGAFCQKMVNHI